MQNYLNTSRATEIGRGKKDTKMCELPEWTPGPGAYDLKTDFVKKEASKAQFVTNEKGETEEVITNYVPWDQAGLR